MIRAMLAIAALVLLLSYGGLVPAAGTVTVDGKTYTDVVVAVIVNPKAPGNAVPVVPFDVAAKGRTHKNNIQATLFNSSGQWIAVIRPGKSVVKPKTPIRSVNARGVYTVQIFGVNYTRIAQTILMHKNGTVAANIR